MSDHIDSLFEEAKDVFKRRNKQYGTQNIIDAGVTGVVARIRDKLARIEHSTDQNAARDAGIDLANYGLILAALAEGTWTGERRELQIVGPLHEPAVSGDVGFDLALTEDVVVEPGKITYVSTGVKILCPSGLWARLSGRSSLARKFGVLCVEGVIDELYTGELLCGLYTIGSSSIPFKTGQRVAQVIFYERITPPRMRVEMLPETARGTNGFGSTGA